MTPKEIVEKLCNHEITKGDAISLINGKQRKMKNSIKFTVESVAFTSESNHGILTIMLPYGYDKIKNKLSKGDSVQVLIK